MCPVCEVKMQKQKNFRDAGLDKLPGGSLSLPARRRTIYLSRIPFSERPIDV